MTTKKDLINNMHHKMPHLTKDDVVESVDLILNYLADNLRKHNPIEIRGFGSFSVRNRKYAGSAKKYNTIYYRMSKLVVESLNK